MNLGVANLGTNPTTTQPAEVNVTIVAITEDFFMVLLVLYFLQT